MEDRHKQLRDEWQNILSQLFVQGIPETAEWHSPSDIVDVLNAISSKANHMFYPNGGGMDVMEAQLDNQGNLEWAPSEEGLKRIAYVANPLKLSFWNPGAYGHEAHFKLEVGSLEPIEDSSSGAVEELTEIFPGEYELLAAWESGVTSSGADLDDAARRVSRFLKPGSFVIFSKGSVYNTFRDKGFDAYNAFHNNEKAFKSMVEQMAALDLDK